MTVDWRTGEDPIEIGILLIPQFPIVAFDLVTESLKAANWLSGRKLFQWRTFSVDGKPVEAGNGTAITPDGPISRSATLRALLVIAGYIDPGVITKPMLDWLRRLDRHGARIGTLDSGAFVLASAGLLDGYRVTLHLEARAPFSEQFPDVEVVDSLYVFDRNRFTGAGGTATLDMMLALIEQAHGRALALAVAQNLIHTRVRSGAESQVIFGEYPPVWRHPLLETVVCTMEANLEDPVPVRELAVIAGVSRRKLERIFRRYLDCPPNRLYTDLRLNRGRQLLLQSEMSVISIAAACGFRSVPVFSRAYRTRFGQSPSRDRHLLRMEHYRPFLPARRPVLRTGAG